MPWPLIEPNPRREALLACGKQSQLSSGRPFNRTESGLESIATTAGDSVSIRRRNGLKTLLNAKIGQDVKSTRSDFCFGAIHLANMNNLLAGPSLSGSQPRA